MDRRSFLRATACAGAAAAIAPVAALIPPPATLRVLKFGPEKLEMASVVVPRTGFDALTAAQARLWGADLWEAARDRTFPRHAPRTTLFT